MPNCPLLKGLIELIEKHYPLKVINSDYVLVDAKYELYNMMLEVQLSHLLWQKFQAKYGQQDTAMHVVWSIYQGRIRFNAAVGNNILLLLDSLTEKTKKC